MKRMKIELFRPFIHTHGIGTGVKKVVRRVIPAFLYRKRGISAMPDAAV